MVITFKTLLCLPTFLNFTVIRLGAPLFLVAANNFKLENRARAHRYNTLENRNREFVINLIPLLLSSPIVVSIQHNQINGIFSKVFSICTILT
jgi:hypothetical protein